MDALTMALTAALIFVSYQAGRWLRRSKTTKCTRCGEGWLER